MHACRHTALPRRTEQHTLLHEVAPQCQCGAFIKTPARYHAKAGTWSGDSDVTTAHSIPVYPAAQHACHMYTAAAAAHPATAATLASLPDMRQADKVSRQSRDLLCTPHTAAANYSAQPLPSPTHQIKTSSLEGKKKATSTPLLTVVGQQPQKCHSEPQPWPPRCATATKPAGSHYSESNPPRHCLPDLLPHLCRVEGPTRAIRLLPRCQHYLRRHFGCFCRLARGYC